MTTPRPVRGRGSPSRRSAVPRRPAAARRHGEQAAAGRPRAARRGARASRRSSSSSSSPFQAPDLNAASARQLLTEIPLPAERGPILDSAGKPLAFSIEANALVTNPRTIARTHGAGTAEYVTRMASAIGQATGQDPAALQALLTADKGYVVLAKLVDPGVAQAMHDQFPEIALERRESRQYPGGSLAANVIGSATWDATDTPGKLTGRIGLESSQDNLLSGSNGVREVDTAEGSTRRDPRQRPLRASRGARLHAAAHPRLRPAVHRAARALGLRREDRRQGRQLRRRARRGDRQGARPGHRRRRSTRATPARRRPTSSATPRSPRRTSRGRSTRSSRCRRRSSTASRSRTTSSTCPAASGSPTARSTTPGSTA